MDLSTVLEGSTSSAVPGSPLSSLSPYSVDCGIILQVLRKMLNGPFREAEAADVHLTDICPQAAHQMLLFIHTDTCDLFKELRRTASLAEKQQRREALMGLITAADKYDVQVR